MEGYSVTEAASVLGVPTERVWELLARGILAGAPDGETGMRVFLQPRPTPAAPAPAPQVGHGGSGNQAREPEREMSPFRELLSEFRNLTERYGQALLALGESRGEVASLRSRVDMLEARIELRLPPAAPAPSAGWPPPMPQQIERRVEPATPGLEEAGHAAEADEEAPSRRRKAKRATESFAEALARAEDPTAPELPGADEAAAAIAALRQEGGTRSDAAAPETTLPHELPVAEPMPVLEEAEPESAESEEHEPERAEPETAEPETAEPERAEPERGELAANAAPPEPPAAPLDWDHERYTTEIGDPDWYAGMELPEAAPPAEVGSDQGRSPMVADAPIERDGRFEAPVALTPPDRGPEPAPPRAKPAPSPWAARPAAVTAPRPTATTPASRAYRRLRRIFPG